MADETNTKVKSADSDIQQLIEQNKKYKRMLLEKENKLIEMTDQYFNLKTELAQNPNSLTPAVPSGFSLRRVLLISANKLLPLQSKRREFVKKVARPFYKHG